MEITSTQAVPPTRVGLRSYVFQNCANVTVRRGALTSMSPPAMAMSETAQLNGEDGADDEVDEDEEASPDETEDEETEGGDWDE